MSQNLEQMIATARQAFAGIDRINPDAPSYKKLCALLDRADDDALKTLMDNNIRLQAIGEIDKLIS